MPSGDTETIPSTAFVVNYKLEFLDLHRVRALSHCVPYFTLYPKELAVAKLNYIMQ